MGWRGNKSKNVISLIIIKSSDKEKMQENFWGQHGHNDLKEKTEVITGFLPTWFSITWQVILLPLTLRWFKVGRMFNICFLLFAIMRFLPELIKTDTDIPELI